MDHLPPPPYSEHDTESISTSHVARPRPALTPTTSNRDTASAPGRPVSVTDEDSSIGDPVYTPPYTPEFPKDSHHRGVLWNDSDPLASATTVIAASAYFESRPVEALSTDTLLIHNIVVTRDTQPTDLPFPKPEESWMERDVLPVDWQTFVNYLIPHYMEASNSGIADRKLRAELIDERMSRLTLGPEDRSRTNLDSVDAQLEPLRQFHGGQEISTDINSVVRMWNEGFFGPRGLLVEASVSDADEGSRAMPGSWLDYPIEEATSTCEKAPRGRFSRGFGGSWIRADHSGFHIGKNLLSADHNGFRMGKSGLVADHNGFRIGNIVVANPQGLKLGPIKADGNGIRIGGRGLAPHPGPSHVSTPHENRGRGRDLHTSESKGQRNRSCSTSSSSSSSSSSSFRSVGSLPDYDHMDNGQLPIARQAVSEWLRHPEQIITKEAVSKTKKELKAAKGQKIFRSEEERKALKLEVCELLKQFKTLKREQKQRWRAAKRERRAARRIAKRARRAAKRQVKNAAKEDRRQLKRDGKRRECHPSINHIPAMPGTLPRDNAFAEEATTDRTGWPSTANSQPSVARAFELQQDETCTMIARRRAAATRISVDAEQMQADVDRMRTQADLHDRDDKARLRLLDVAERLQEEAEKLRREGETLMAEVQQSEEDLQQQGGCGSRQEDPFSGQESGVIHNRLDAWIKAENEKHQYKF